MDDNVAEIDQHPARFRGPFSVMQIGAGALHGIL